MLELNEKDDFIKLGKSCIRLSYLRNVTLEEAIEHLKRSCHEDRIRNAWKRANRKK